MDTATPAITPSESSGEKTTAPGTSVVRDIDPDHDIDAKKTVIALVLSAIGVFVSVYLLFQLFTVVIFDVRVEKVEQSPTPQLDQIRQHEAQALGAGNGRISIEDSIQELVDK